MMYHKRMKRLFNWRVGLSLLLILGIGGVIAVGYKKPHTTTSPTIKLTYPEPDVLGTSTAEPEAKPTADNHITTVPVPAQPKTTALTSSPNPVTEPAPKIDRSGIIAACEASKQFLIDSYPVYVNQATGQHQSYLSAIQADWASRGLAFSGPAQAEKDAENLRYQNQLQELETAYQHELASYVCV